MQPDTMGIIIRTLRKEAGLTQQQLAQSLQVTAQAVSKWERGLGCPDLSLLPELSRLFGVSIERLLSTSEEPINKNGGTMHNTKFYFCPQCGNLITSTGAAALSCCGRTLPALSHQTPEGEHLLHLEPVEDEWLLTTSHPMTKEHYLSFCALVTADQTLVVRRWPEWDFQVRLPRRGHGFLYWYCTQHGLFRQKL